MIQYHLNTMCNDCHDFHRVTEAAGIFHNYESLIGFKDKIYQGKWPLLCCIGILRVLSKIHQSKKKGILTL